MSGLTNGLRFKSAILAAAVITTGAIAANADELPFSGPDSVAYADDLWGALQEAKLVGKDSIQSFPYEGNPPHGVWLTNLETRITVNGHTGEVLVKKNYGPSADADPTEIMTDRMKHLGAVTVMFKREAGYDSDNQNWFWAKYLPDGSLDKNPKGMQLAGRVAKGANQGCIACHAAAPGGDYIFSHDRLAE